MDVSLILVSFIAIVYLVFCMLHFCCTAFIYAHLLHLLIKLSIIIIIIITQSTNPPASLYTDEVLTDKCKALQYVHYH